MTCAACAPANHLLTHSIAPPRRSRPRWTAAPVLTLSTYQNLTSQTNEPHVYLSMFNNHWCHRSWQLVRSCLTKLVLPQLVASVLALLLISRVIEPVYGSKAYLKFLGIVLSFSGLSAFVSVRLLYLHCATCHAINSRDSAAAGWVGLWVF